MFTDTDSELNQWLEMLRSVNEGDRLVAVKSLQHLGEDAAVDGSISSLLEQMN